MHWYLWVMLWPSGEDEDTWEAQHHIKHVSSEIIMMHRKERATTFDSRCVLHPSLVWKCWPHAAQAKSSEGHPLRLMVGSQGEWSNLPMTYFIEKIWNICAQKTFHMKLHSSWNEERMSTFLGAHQEGMHFHKSDHSLSLDKYVWPKCSWGKNLVCVFFWNQYGFLQV